MELSDIRRRAADLTAQLELAKDTLHAESRFVGDAAHRRDELAELEQSVRSVQRLCDWLEPEIGQGAEEAGVGSEWLNEELARVRMQGAEAEARARRSTFARGGDLLEFGVAHAQSELAKAKKAYFSRFLRMSQQLQASETPLPEIMRDLEIREVMSALLLWWDIVEKKDRLPNAMLRMAEEKVDFYEKKLSELAGTR